MHVIGDTRGIKRMRKAHAARTIERSRRSPPAYRLLKESSTDSLCLETIRIIVKSSSVAITLN
jgi:hypothetical protein